DAGVEKQIPVRLARCGELSRFRMQSPKYPGLSLSNRRAFLRRRFFHHDACAICQNFRNSLLNVVCIVTEADHRIGTVLGGVVHHQLKRVLTGLFAHLRIERDIPAGQGLQAGPDGAEDGARAHNNSTHNSAIARNTISGQFECCCDHSWAERCLSGHPFLRKTLRRVYPGSGLSHRTGGYGFALLHRWVAYWRLGERDGRTGFLQRKAGTASAHPYVSALPPVGGVSAELDGAAQKEQLAAPGRRAGSRPFRQGAIVYGIARRPGGMPECSLP